MKQSKVPTVLEFPRTSIDPSHILTKEQLAERLKVSPRVVYGLTRTRSRNPIPFFRIGKVLRFNWLSVSEWLERQQQAA